MTPLTPYTNTLARFAPQLAGALFNKYVALGAQALLDNQPFDFNDIHSNKHTCAILSLWRTPPRADEPC